MDAEAFRQPLTHPHGQVQLAAVQQQVVQLPGVLGLLAAPPLQRDDRRWQQLLCK